MDTRHPQRSDGRTRLGMRGGRGKVTQQVGGVHGSANIPLFPAGWCQDSSKVVLDLATSLRRHQHFSITISHHQLPILHQHLLINFFPSTSPEQQLSISITPSTSLYQHLSINLSPLTSLHLHLSLNIAPSTSLQSPPTSLNQLLSINISL